MSPNAAFKIRAKKSAAPSSPYRIISCDETGAWEEALAPFGGGDVYYRPAYLSALKNRGEGEALLLHTQKGDFRGCHVFLARPLEGAMLSSGDEGRVDLASPYGYSGPLLTHRDRASVSGFLDSWTEAAGELGAIAEFIRFHPVLETHRPFQGLFPIRRAGRTVAVSLRERPVREGLSKICKKNLATAEKRGVAIDFAPREGLSRFLSLYRHTMRRRDAGRYYDFPDSYFADLALGFGEDLWLVFATHDGEDAAVALILRSGEYIHYHLGGSRHEKRALCATNLLLVRIAEKAREMGLRAFHLGGGLREGDGLFRFKSGFSPDRLEFHVGCRIYDQKIYRRLAASRREEGTIDDDYFPAYRAPILP